MRSINLTCIIAFLFLSCSENSRANFEFPLNPGNTWNYQHLINLYSYPMDTEFTGYVDSTTYVSDVTMLVSESVTLRDSIETFPVSSIEIDSTGTYTLTNYINADEDGMYILAYQGNGPIITPKLKKSKTSYRFQGKAYDSIHDILKIPLDLIPRIMIKGIDGIIFEDQPVTVYPYPLEIGEQWRFRQIEDWRIDKKIESRLNYRIELGTFDCYRIRWMYDMAGDGTWDDDIYIEDHLSRKGIIQRDIVITGIEETSPQMPSGTGSYLDLVESFILTDFDVE